MTYLVVSGKPQPRSLVILIVGDVQIIGPSMYDVVALLTGLGVLAFGWRLDDGRLQSTNHNYFFTYF